MLNLSANSPLKKICYHSFKGLGSRVCRLFPQNRHLAPDGSCRILVYGSSFLAGLALLLFSSLPAQGRESKFTREGVAPLYWMAYEQCFVDDRPLDESRWRKNIDWVAENLLPYGYDMVCTDGWIEGAQTIDGNGYITQYNSGWGQGFKFYISYASRKGLRSGVYYNPLWMTRAAYDADVTVKGTSYTSRQLKGDKNFNDALYWVDTDRPGAEQWVKGYVRHFIDLGFDFLRVDFLNHYENGYGTIRYRRALKWIMEEAGDEIMISLVMPNCYEHAKNERVYGDMFRISEDVFGGGFDFVSQRRRGQWQNGWANWGNLYDGFLDFSDIDRSDIIMDGDFVRLNTAALECEKEFWISLLLMAGSPIAVADQYDTAGDNLKYYRNERILSLVKEGFSAKPLSRDMNSVESSHWKGECGNGDIVMAFFNREENATVRTINPADYGLSGMKYFTDLWTGDKSELSGEPLKIRLASHGCKLYRFSINRGDSGADMMPATDNNKTEIYDLQGRKIDTDSYPTLKAGIYIVRKGGKSYKQVIK